MAKFLPMQFIIVFKDMEKIRTSFELLPNSQGCFGISPKSHRSRRVRKDFPRLDGVGSANERMTQFLPAIDQGL